MRLALSPEESQLVDAVEAFLADHFKPVADAPLGLAATLTPVRVPHPWFDALCGAGWSVPGWPVADGGTGWTRRQHWHFERLLAQAGAPSPASVATTFAGPMLLAHGSDEQRRRLLPEIRDLQVAWCVAVADAKTTTVSKGEMRGVKAWVAGAGSAQWALVWAQGWWVVPIDTPGVAVEPVPMMGNQLDVCRLHFEGVAVAAWQRIACDDRQWQAPFHPAGWTRAARLAHTLQRIDLLAGENGGALAQDADFRRERNALEVAVASVQALELRAVDAWAGARDSQPLSLVAAVKGVQAGQELSALAARSMGYYSLPYPDALLLSNEGVIGHELALPAVQQMLFDRAWSLHTSAGASETTEQLKNRVAAQVLGLPEDAPQGD